MGIYTNSIWSTSETTGHIYWFKCSIQIYYGLAHRIAPFWLILQACHTPVQGVMLIQFTGASGEISYNPELLLLFHLTK